MRTKISNLTPGPFFERLLLYVLVTGLLTRIVFELCLGLEPKALHQQRQWIFYGLLAIDYGWQCLNWHRFRMSRDRAHLIIPILVLMIFHGVIVGLLYDNSKTRILIDTANVLVVLFNIVLLGDSRSFQGFDFGRLERRTYFIGGLLVATGFGAMLVNSKSAPDLGSSTSTAVAMVILCVGLLLAPSAKGHLYRLLGLAVLLGFSMPTWNRTTIGFLVLVLILHLARNFVGRPLRVALIAALALLGGIAALHLVPEDSKFARRIAGLQDVDLSERTGSIGERQAELDAISEKIGKMGLTGIMFGAGHGASYDVKYTWNVKRDYSNAHYGWALFYLRWGFLGYFYLLVWGACLLSAFLRHVLSSRPEFLIVSLLALFTIGYLGTYSYFLFFIAGIPFALPPRLAEPQRPNVLGLRGAMAAS